MYQMKLLKIWNNLILAKDKVKVLELGKSVETIINNRIGRIFSSMIEVSAILDDVRIHTIGGRVAWREIYE